MSYLDPVEAFEHYRDRSLEAIRSQFPVDGRNQVLELEKLEVQDNLDPDDIRSQHQAKVSGQTWGVPVVAHLILRDKLTGKEVRAKTRIADLPKVTCRHSQIVSGQEYQVDNQWQLKPGAYVRRKQTGQIETQFQSTRKPSFKVTFDDESKEFRVEFGTKARIPLYPLLSTLGASDADLEKTWGKDILAANKGARNVAGAVDNFYRTTRRVDPPSQAAAISNVTQHFKDFDLRPDATAVTLGRPADHVDSDVLLRATRKMIDVHGGAPEDDRDSLIFKDLRSVGDFSFEKILKEGPAIRRKMQRQINDASSPRDVVRLEAFNKPIRETFYKNSAAQVAKQVNPVEMLSAAQQTTVMGPGGIQSENAILDEVKFINPSHMCFLDPIHTPEGSKTGITLRMPLGVRKHGMEPQVPLYNTRTGTTDYVGPATFLRSRVVLPDQVEWHGDHPVQKGPMVKWSAPGNEIAEGHLKDADYVMRHPSQFFNVTSNLIPFVGNTSGGRASMATRHMEQAISLEHRESPLVQVGTGRDWPGASTFEEVVGTQASHHAPVAGTVKKVGTDAIVVTDEAGHDHEVQTYRNYPLNDAKSVLDSTALVKPGDHVKKGQVIADTNFSKNGVIALGTNLRVAYIPFKGYNFEDGVVVSASAAKKLSSVHLHKHNLSVDDDTILAKSRFLTQHIGLYNKDQVSMIGDDGVVRVGSRVQPGDPLILAMKKTTAQDRTGLSAIRKSLGDQFSDQSLTWHGEGPGEVVGSFRHGGEVIVHVKAIEPMQVGDKLAGRYGNKGIVTKVVPDAEMPHTKDGDPIEVALNPSGVPGRMNLGQVFETAASKIAKKTGKPYVVNNFNGSNQLAKLQKELSAHGISDTEVLIDPVTGHTLGPAMVGYQHLIKLHHQVDKKVSVRSGLNLPGQEPGRYDINMQPSGGGHAGGQSMDPLGLYAMLAHGARANIREMQTWKSEGPDMSTSPQKQWQSQHHDVWDAIQHGDALPTPKPTFAFKKFTDMLIGAGINIEKRGHELVLSPLTDAQIKNLTGDRVLPKPAELLYAKIDAKTGEPRPKPGGLFDEKLTGGHGGKKWSRIELSEPVPNPIFESSIKAITGLSSDAYMSLVEGRRAIDAAGHDVPVGKGLTGGAAIQHLLSNINVDSALRVAKKELSTVPASKVDSTLKKVKRLQALQQAGMSPAEAYVLHNLPVLPPAMRPIPVLPDGNFSVSDINELYSQFAQVNSQLGDPTLIHNLTEEQKVPLRAGVYDGVKALQGIGVPYADAQYKGLIHQIHGAQPKTGYFQSTLISRKQDLSMRSTIVPEPSLSLDEVGLPAEHAMKLFAPFVVGELKRSGVSATVLDAQKLVAKNTVSAQRALRTVMKDRPVLLKRDPALHKYSIQAFRPKVVEGNAVKIHPLVTGGYNADFDGDTMSVFVPISDEAVAEARKMFPSNNLFSEATGSAMYQPTLESALGLYKLSRVNDGKAHDMSHPAAALLAVQSGKINVNDKVKIGSQVTTPGRILVSAALPEPMQKRMLEDLTFSLDKKGLGKLLTQVGKEHSSDYSGVADKLKDIGNGASSGVVTVEHDGFVGADRLDPSKRMYIPVGVHTLGLEDLAPDITTRERVLGPARKKVEAIENNPHMQGARGDREIVKIWADATSEMKQEHLSRHAGTPNNLMTMHLSGVKPGWDQYKQLTLAPMLVKDASGRTITTPIMHSYAEGLDTGEYWTQMHGARHGAVMKVQEVREPGYLSKLMMANTMDMVVSGHDCHTERGISLPVTEDSVHDRFLQKDFSAKGMHVEAGTLLTPDIVSKMRSADRNAKIEVRSPLKCEHAKGVCQKCMGIASTGQLHGVGENVGVVSAQSLGERAMQLTLRVFHTGGSVDVGGGSKALGGFDRFNELMTLPKKLPNSATLAMRTGVIEKVEKDATGVNVFIGGKKHHIGKDVGGQPLWKTESDEVPVGWTPPHAGMRVDKGQLLSDPRRTVVNPHDLYKATGSIESVQNYMTDAMYQLYKDEGIKRGHIETVVKAMSNLTKIRDPGDYDGVLRGEFQPTSVITAVNRELARHGKRLIEHEPELKGVEMMPLSLQEDWMAKMQHEHLRTTLLDAANTGGRSNLHGLHPIPGMAYGAEFGLTSAHAKGRLSLSHLHDVPEHAY